MKLTEINKRMRELELITKQRELTKDEEGEYNWLWDKKDKRQGIIDFQQKKGKVF